jgi:hypothetical protein
MRRAREPAAMGRLLVVVGVASAGLGVLLMLGAPLGRLPGDIVFRRGSFTLYVPIGTSIVLSLVLSLALLILKR